MCNFNPDNEDSNVVLKNSEEIQNEDQHENDEESIVSTGYQPIEFIPSQQLYLHLISVKKI